MQGDEKIGGGDVGKKMEWHLYNSRLGKTKTIREAILPRLVCHQKSILKQFGGHVCIGSPAGHFIRTKGTMGEHEYPKLKPPSHDVWMGIDSENIMTPTPAAGELPECVREDYTKTPHPPQKKQAFMLNQHPSQSVSVSFSRFARSVR